MIDIATLPKRERKAPAVHTDSMPPTEHPCDGKIYDSKSAFRQITAQHGCREVGTDWKNVRFHPMQQEIPDEEYEDAVGEAYRMIRDEGFKPPPLETIDSWEGELGEVPICPSE